MTSDDRAPGGGRAVMDRAANLLGALSLLTERRVRQVVEEASGQSISGTAALVTLAEFLDGGPIDSLRQVLGLTSSGTVRVVDRLEDAGYVRRDRGEDARVAALSLTARGKRAVTAVERARAEVLGGALQVLSPRERRQYERMTARVIEALIRNGPVPGVGTACRLCDPGACGRWDGDCPVRETARELMLRDTATPDGAGTSRASE